MFCYFVKLVVCGVLDNIICDVYNELIMIVFQFSGSMFGSIYFDIWWQYCGWFSLGFFDWGDLGVMYFDDYDFLVIFGMGCFLILWMIRYYFVDEFVKNKGYYKLLQLFFCFFSNVKVVMVGFVGEKLKKICNVEFGDVVLFLDVIDSGGFLGIRCVVFVSVF